MTDTAQKAIPLRLAPNSGTLERLFATFGDELIPLEELRLRYFRNLNTETFNKALGTERIPLPLITLDDSNKAPKYVSIRHLATYIEQRAYQADQITTARITPDDTTR
ncbi:MAG: transcriptional regulator [Gammaproteobacteria bacterium HGW-Gammaproteobacteria-11]|nr:MAG: transcriptional regulator [Gammaproteobacteria bacterium HGW-Gammaproteobacteria-11]